MARSANDQRSQGRSDKEQSIQTNRESARGRNDVARRRPGLLGSDMSPSGVMRRMSEDMERFFTGFGLDTPRIAWAPQLETFRRGDQIVVRADLPGMKKEDVKVEVDNGMLSISGERREEHDETRDNFYRTERRYGHFHRSLSLPEGVTSDQCEASFKDGVLEVTIPAPKTAERKSKRVQVR